MRRTCLKDPRLTPGIWPCWYKWDDYLVGNVDPSRIVLDQRLTSFLKKSIKVRLFTKEQSCKWGAVGAKSAASINIIFALLEGILGGLRIWSNWLQPKGTNLCRIAFFGTGVPYLEESPRASESLYQNESVVGRFCKSKSLVPLLQSGVWKRFNWVSPNGLANLLGIEKLELEKGGRSYQTWSRATPRMLSVNEWSSVVGGHMDKSAES